MTKTHHINLQCVGYESESTLYPDTDCDDIWDESTTDHDDTETEDDKSRMDSVSPVKRYVLMLSSICEYFCVRYCWQCHSAGHDQLSCDKTTLTGPSPDTAGLCPRCLQTDHWEDDCPLTTAPVLCTVCSSPGHLTAVHSAQDFTHRKLIIDTFGWLSFKHWFTDLEFRSWWNSSGFTGVPLTKIVIRQNSNNRDI